VFLTAGDIPTIQLEDNEETKIRIQQHTVIYLLVGGFNPSEKYEFVSWDDYPIYYGNVKNVPNHQPV